MGEKCDSLGLPWVAMDYYGLVWIAMDSFGFPQKRFVDIKDKQVHAHSKYCKEIKELYQCIAERSK